MKALSSGTIEGEIMSLGSAYVHPTHKASGVGKAMILKSIDNAKPPGLRVIPPCALAAGLSAKGDGYGSLFRGGKA